MQTQSQISVDLNRPYIQTVQAMQHDGGTRVVDISLLQDGAPWQPPAGVSVAIGYEKPDHTRGLYDKLPDGTAAIGLSGNVVTVILAQQMLSVPGTVRACVVFNDAQLNQLSTFPFQIQVQVNPAVDAPQSENYCRLQWLEDKLDEYLMLAKQSGEFTGPTGPAPVLLGQEIAFQVSTDFRQIPTGPWRDQVPSAAPREYLWTRTTVHFDTGDVVSYSVSRNGADGMGAVCTVCGNAPDDSGDVVLTAEDVGALPCVGGNIQGEINMNGQKLTGLAAPTEDMDAANRLFVEEQAEADAEAARQYTAQYAKTQVLSTLLYVSDWTGDSAPYTAFVPILNLNPNRRLRAYPLFYGDDPDGELAVKEACAAVSFAIRSDDGVTFTCLEEKPAVNIPVSIELYM